MEVSDLNPPRRMQSSESDGVISLDQHRLQRRRDQRGRQVDAATRAADLLHAALIGLVDFDEAMIDVLAYVRRAQPPAWLWPAS